MAFALDTSGTVFLPLDNSRDAYDGVAWEDLAPFAQGKVEALFASAAIEFPAPGTWMDDDHGTCREVGFSDLSPEALAMIVGDCEAFCAAYPINANTDARDLGRRFYRGRALGNWPRFPPLTPYLGDDGKIYLRAA